MTLLSLLITVIVFCLFYWAVTRLMAAFGVGEPVSTIVIVLLVVLFALWLLQAFGVLGGHAIRLT